MKIRKAKPSDVEDLAKLYLQFWRAHKNCDPLIEPKSLSLKSEVKSAKKDLRKKNTFVFVAEINNKVVGYIEILIKKNDKMFKIKNFGFLNSAVTHKNYRKKGVAKALTTTAFSFLKKKGIKYIKLNVYNANKTAFKTWQKLGFRAKSTTMLKRL